MTNTEAITKLTNIMHDDHYAWHPSILTAFGMAVDALRGLPSAQPTHNNTSNALKSLDCIDRQAAIDAECEVCQIAPKKERGHNCTYYVHGCKEIECLRALPSAQPEIIRCCECKFASGDSRICMKFDHSPIGELDFCSFAERREVTT